MDSFTAELTNVYDTSDPRIILSTLTPAATIRAVHSVTDDGYAKIPDKSSLHEGDQASEVGVGATTPTHGKERAQSRFAALA